MDFVEFGREPVLALRAYIEREGESYVIRGVVLERGAGEEAIDLPSWMQGLRFVDRKGAERAILDALELRIAEAA